MIPKCQGREKLMQMEDCFEKDGKENTCLCFKEKDQYVFYVQKRCSERVYVCILRPNLKKTKNCPRIKGKLHLQQNLLSNVALTASFIVAEEIAHSSKSFS